MRKTKRNQGFSLLEVSIATAIFVTISVAFFQSVQKDLTLHNRQHAKSQLSMEGQGALRVIRSELVQAGRVTLSGKTYPYYWTTSSSGSSLSASFSAHAHAFVAPSARKGLAFMTDLVPPSPLTQASFTTIREIAYVKPKYASSATGRIADQQPVLDATTGKIVWDPAEYDFVIVPGTDGILELQHRVFGGKFKDGATVHVLARHAQWLSFTDPTVDATLGPDQIQVDLWMAARDMRNDGQQEWSRTDFTMRNRVR